MQKRSQDGIYLSFIRTGDRVSVVDQSGREVQGVRNATLSVGVDQVAEIVITVLDAPRNTESPAHLGNRE